VNLVNLLLARGTARQRELSTRLALGAGRGAIVRQLLTESALLAGLGGLAGVAVAYVGRRALPGLLTESWRPALLVADFDWQVLLFAGGVTLLAGLLLGAVPVWQGMQADLNDGLKDGSHATMGLRKASVGKGLVVLQVGLSTILLLAAGLFVRTLTNLAHIPLGFRADHMLMFKISPPRTRHNDSQMIALFQRIEEKLAAIPGVRAATLSNIAIIGDGHSGSTFHVTGRPLSTQEARVQTNNVGADFFATMAIPVLQGRGFTRHDNANAPKVAVVNRWLSATFPRRIRSGERLKRTT